MTSDSLQGSREVNGSERTEVASEARRSSIGRLARFLLVESRLLWVVPAILSMIVAATSVPSVITPDGYAYLLGADVIGSSGMPDFFPWYREPLYPVMLLAMTGLAGSTDLGLVIAQAGALGIGATLIVSAFLPGTRRWIVVLLATLLACSPINIGYAGTVLQQAWFLLALGMYTWLISWTWRTKPSRSWVAFVLALPLMSLWVHLGQQMVYIGAPLGLGITAGFLHRYLSPGGDPEGLPRVFTRVKSPAARAAAGLVLAALVATLFTAWGSASLKPWERFKTEQIAKRTGEAIYLTDLGLSVNVVRDQILKDPATFFSRLPADARGILSLGPSTWPPLQGAQENHVIIGHAFTEEQFRCGVGLPPGASPDVQLASDVLAQRCRTEVGHRWLGRAMPVGHLLTSLSGFLFLAAPVVLMMLRHWRALTLMLVPYTFFALYLALNAGIDRYGMPLYPFGLAAGAAVFVAALDRPLGRYVRTTWKR